MSEIQDINELTEQYFSILEVRDDLDARLKDIRSKIQLALETSGGFEHCSGVGVPGGTYSVKVRRNFRVDNFKLLELIQDNPNKLKTLLVVGTYKPKDIEKFGFSEVINELEPTKILELKRSK